MKRFETTKIAMIPSALSDLQKVNDNLWVEWGMSLTSKFPELVSVALGPMPENANQNQWPYTKGLAKNEWLLIEPMMLHKLKESQKSVRYLSSEEVVQYLVPIKINGALSGVIYFEIEATNNEREIFQRVLQYTLTEFKKPENKPTSSGLSEQIAAMLVALIRAKDTYTAGHSERVAMFSVAIGEMLNLGRQEIQDLRLSALIHDIGKIGIPDNILKKPGSLTHEEYAIMMLHPDFGEQTLASLNLSADVLSGVQLHHEKWDGSGYPFGLAGEEIPLFARIIAVADALDAMTSGRTYSGFIQLSAAISELKLKVDLFDPKVLEALERAEKCGLFANGETRLSFG